MYIDDLGRLNTVLQRPSSHCDERPHGEVSLLVIHNISLPAGQFLTPYVDDLFMGCIDCNAHETFSDLQGLRAQRKQEQTDNVLKIVVKTYQQMLNQAPSVYFFSERCI